MHNKQFILAVFLLLFSPLSFGYVSYDDESTAYSDSYETYDSGSQPYDDYNSSKPYRDDDYYATSSAFSDSPPVEEEYYEDDERRNYNSRTPRLPRKINPPGEKVIIVDPRSHGWGAYTPEGILVRSGLATAGGKWCRDTGRSCRTSVGSFRIFSLGNSDCVSSIYPLEEGGGAPMPYCMFFNGSQGLHGSNQVREANVSHGCVRVSVGDAEWIRFQFATIGTKVIVMPY